MDHFSLLPAELQIAIFDYLETVDAKAVRAVCRIFWDNATPALFRSIVACARHRALGAYQKISLHPIYSSYVREIIFDGTLYRKNLADSKHSYWQAEIRYDKLYRSESEIGHGIQVLDASVEYRWKRYRTLYKEQERMNSNGFLFRSLARGLEKMQNVSSIVFSPEPHTIPIEKEKTLPDTVSKDYHQTYLWATVFTAPNHPFRQLIYAVYLSQHTGLRQLIIRAPWYEAYGLNKFSLSMFALQSTHDMHAAKHVFRHLTKLELYVWILHSFGAIHFPSVQETVQKQLENMFELVKTAQDLRHLSLALPIWSMGSMWSNRLLNSTGCSMFGDVGLGATWPMLRSVKLESIEVTSQHLVGFIARHRATLEVLKLSLCSMTDGFWADVVDETVFNSPVTSTFVLNLVDEVVGGSVNDPVVWVYDGCLSIGVDGERKFICIVPDICSLLLPHSPIR